MSATQRTIDWTEQGLVPDTVIRHGIRRLLKARLITLAGDVEAQAIARSEFIRVMHGQPIALTPQKANVQHFELPEEFFSVGLGCRDTYSCC